MGKGVGMPAEASLVRSLLKDVTLEGAVVVEKRKLLWLLGWGQDRSGAWDELLSHWLQIGQDRDTLYGCEVQGKVILSMKLAKPTFEPVSNWV